MRGFAFTVDMLFGALVVILLFSILIHAAKPTNVPQQALLQIQAKDAVMVWFYSTPDAYTFPPSGYRLSCPSVGVSSCACDTAFRPNVTTSYQDPTISTSWIVQQVCVVTP